MSVQSPNSSDITPKRKFGIKGSLTPMNSIREEDINENEVRKTPAPYNPFDVNADSLYFHSCSPFFATISRNKENNGTFRWSIEQLSVLCPADIDETSFPDDCIDSDQEIKVQKAIDTFFSQNSIVPSPWSDSPSSKEGRRDKFRRTSLMSFNRPKAESCDTATQTALSIPPDVDLTEILGNFFKSNDEDSFCSRENSQEEIDPLSTSSLRRKLFVTEEECISPPRVENKNLFSARLWSTPTAKSCSAHSTPASDVLSSSPITPPNCSESCNILSPPPVSPISFANDRKSLSVHMKSMIDDSSSNIYYSPENMTFGQDNEMSFLTESQDANPLSSCNNSEKQDTGYVTGSISSSQNMNFSEVNYGIVSRISPVMELMEECGLSNSSSYDMSLKHPPEGDSLLFEGCKDAPVSSCNLETNSWLPTCASTPAYCFDNT